MYNNRSCIFFFGSGSLGFFGAVPAPAHVFFFKRLRLGEENQVEKGGGDNIKLDGTIYTPASLNLEKKYIPCIEVDENQFFSLSAEDKKFIRR